MKLKTIQKRVLGVMDGKTPSTNMQIANKVSSKPGPIARCCMALAQLELCAGSNEKGWRRTAKGTKALDQ